LRRNVAHEIVGAPAQNLNALDILAHFVILLNVRGTLNKQLVAFGDCVRVFLSERFTLFRVKPFVSRIHCIVLVVDVNLRQMRVQRGDAPLLYQNVVNDVLNHPDDKPSIGLLLVKGKNKTVVEYSLAGFKIQSEWPTGRTN
jgi:hypothetical protein